MKTKLSPSPSSGVPFAVHVMPRSLKAFLAYPILGLHLFLYAHASAAGWGSEKAPPEVVEAANKGLPSFLSKVPNDAKSLYGFPNDCDLTTLRLGQPVLLHQLPAGTAIANQGTTNVASLVSATTMRFFPILSGSEVKAMLVVDLESNTWQAVSLGYAPLAREWGQVKKQWPEERGYKPRLIACFQAKKHYFSIPELGADNLTQIISNTKSNFPAPGGSAGAGGQTNKYTVLGTVTNESALLKAQLGESVKTQKASNLK
jgi:hypothetical protein